MGTETPKEQSSKYLTMKIMGLGLFVALIAFVLAHQLQIPFLNSTGLTVNEIHYSTRLYWMQQANEALFKYSGPCPFRAFGTVIVNHTAGRDELVCSGANNVTNSGDPTQHGEINGIQRCVREFIEKGFTPSEISAAIKDLSLYTNAEPCPMCAAAIQQAGFKEYIYGTSIDHLFKAGWDQILISSQDVVAASWPLGTAVKALGSIGTEFTDPLFDWQYQENVACPKECAKSDKKDGTSTCTPLPSWNKGIYVQELAG